MGREAVNYTFGTFLEARFYRFFGRNEPSSFALNWWTLQFNRYGP